MRNKNSFYSRKTEIITLNNNLNKIMESKTICVDNFILNLSRNINYLNFKVQQKPTMKNFEEKYNLDELICLFNLENFNNTLSSMMKFLLDSYNQNKLSITYNKENDEINIIVKIQKNDTLEMGIIKISKSKTNFRNTTKFNINNQDIDTDGDFFSFNDREAASESTPNINVSKKKNMNNILLEKKFEECCKLFDNFSLGTDNIIKDVDELENLNANIVQGIENMKKNNEFLKQLSEI